MVKDQDSVWRLGGGRFFSFKRASDMWDIFQRFSAFVQSERQLGNTLKFRNVNKKEVVLKPG